MPMVPFFEVFKDLAFRETRVLYVFQDDMLPRGEYAFLELYCNEPNCDCRRVLINVCEAKNPGKTLATIGYGWESADYYERAFPSSGDGEEAKGPILDPLNPQTELAPALIEAFATSVATPAYNQRLARHYRMFKDAVCGPPKKRLKGTRRTRKRRKKRKRG